MNGSGRRVVIAGGHGKIGLVLGSLLARRGDRPVGLIRNRGHAMDLVGAGVEAAVCDLERASLDEVAGVVTGADAVVFAAGAGPGSGAARKDTVDRAGAVLLADAAEHAGVRRHIQVSAVGLEAVRDGATPAEMDEVFVAYLRAKLAAEDDLRARDRLDWTILRPGRLTDDPATGLVSLAEHVERDAVPRADVAAVLAALLDAPNTAGKTLELMTGTTPVDTAVADAARA